MEVLSLHLPPSALSLDSFLLSWRLLCPLPQVLLLFLVLTVALGHEIRL